MWAHMCAGYQEQSSFLSAFPHLTAFWATSLNILECACWKWRFIIQSVRLQPQDSERGFWAWGRVTINLVKSTDESLSHSYNQRHFRPLFPQRNSCLLQRVLKFYFKNSQHLKAACSVLPRLSLATCFQFSQSYYRVSGCGMSCYLHQIGRHSGGFSPTFLCLLQEHSPKLPCSSHSKRRVQSQHYYVWRDYTSVLSFVSRGNRGPEKRWNPILPSAPLLLNLKKPDSHPHPASKCLLVVF